MNHGQGLPAHFLSHHPHIHYLLALDGLTPEGTWKLPKNKKYFLPVKALSVRMRTLRLTGHKFVCRLLQHTLPNGFKRVRYYGWLSPAAHKRRAKIRELLAWKPTIPKEPVATTKVPCCPHCQDQLKKILTWHRKKAPPFDIRRATPLHA